MGFGIVIVVAGTALFGWWQGITILMFSGPIVVYGSGRVAVPSLFIGGLRSKIATRRRIKRRHALMPLLDFCIGKDSSHPPERVLDVLEHDPIYRYSTYLFVLLQFALVIGSVRSAWQIERRRLARWHRPALSIHNEVLQSWAMTATLWFALVVMFGARRAGLSPAIGNDWRVHAGGRQLLRALMDKRVAAHYGRDIRRANIQPSQEARMLSGYPPVSPA